LALKSNSASWTSGPTSVPNATLTPASWARTRASEPFLAMTRAFWREKGEISLEVGGRVIICKGDHASHPNCEQFRGVCKYVKFSKRCRACWCMEQRVGKKNQVGIVGIMRGCIRGQKRRLYKGIIRQSVVRAPLSLTSPTIRVGV
jgi:hypothetical protein